MKPSAPSSVPITWIGWVKAKGPKGHAVRVTAQFWVDARDQAAALLGCGRDEVECVLDEVPRAEPPPNDWADCAKPTLPSSSHLADPQTLDDNGGNDDSGDIG